MPSETDEELEVLFTELGSCNTEMGHAPYYKHYASARRSPRLRPRRCC